MGETNTLEKRYQDRLNNMPAPKQGRHQALLAIANLGVLAGTEKEKIHSDIRAVADGIPDREISAAIEKAAADHHAGRSYRPPPRPAPIVKDGQAALKRIILQGKIRDDADLWECSPIRLNDSPDRDPVLFLETLFHPADYIFIGDRLENGIIGRSIRRVSEWIEFFQAGGKAGPFIIINTFTGEAAPTKDGSGKLSYRCDGCIAVYRHCLVEFDTLNREDQLLFWSAVKLPIRALIDTGGKSIHAWLDVSRLSTARKPNDWDREIKAKLYEKILVPLGVDWACCNPSRLSRLPGHLRDGTYQRLLWLSPEGREVVR